MKDELVYVKSNYINYNFKHIGEYTHPDSKLFDKSIERKLYLPSEQADIVRGNKKMLCSFLSLRVKEKNTLMTFVKNRDTKCIVLDLPVTRGMFKRNPNELAFIEPVQDYLEQYLTTTDIKYTYLYVSGVVNHNVLFGIHYTLYIPEDLEKKLKKSDFPNGKSYRISKLQHMNELDSLSQMCIKNYKEVTPNGENN